MRRALALSPHLDDAAFSCGGTLALLADEGWEVTVVTAFTRSVPHPRGFALACQLDKGLPAEVDYMAIRRAEDAEACRILHARPLWLPFPEAPHRGYGSAAALFGVPRATDGIDRPLAAMLAPLLARAELVLAPPAVGGHVDHVLLVRALNAVRPPSLPVLWWTDHPYAARPHSHPAQPFGQVMRALPELVLDGRVELRFAACAAYASQLGFQFGGRDGMRRSLATMECFRRDGCVPGLAGRRPASLERRA